MQWRQRLTPTVCLRCLLVVFLIEPRGAEEWNTWGNCSNISIGSNAANCSCGGNWSNGTNCSNGTNGTYSTDGSNRRERDVPNGTRVIFHRSKTSETNVTDAATEVAAVVGPHGEEPRVFDLKVGELWDELQLVLPASHAPTSWTNPQLRFVSGLASNDEHCSEQWALGADAVSSPGLLPFSTLSLASTVSTDSIVNISWAAISPLRFLLPGQARICFSHNGTFTPPTAELLNFNISLLGLIDACNGACNLAQQRAECYLSSTGQCSLRFGGVVGGLEDSAASWTEAFTALIDNDTGTELSVSAPECASGPPAPDVFGLGVDQLDLLEGTEGKLHLLLPIDARLAEAPATYAVCYCPSSADRECASHADYTQQVGMLLIYMSAVCDPSEGSDCLTKYDSTIVGHRFMISVFCPPQGCRSGTGSRIKLVARNATTNLPSWDAMNGCRHAAHLDSWLPRGNCISPNQCSEDGGPRQDRRNWGSSDGWWAWEPEQNPGVVFGSTLNPGAERLDLRDPQDADVCFCDGSCGDSNAAWFKVGEMRIAATRLAAGSNLKQAPTLVGAPGALHLARPPDDANALGLKGNGTMKLLVDPDVSMTAADCDRMVGGVSPLAVGDNASSERLALFAEGTSIIIDTAGTVAVCYCSSISTADSCSAGGFLLAGRFTVHGPVPDQSFHVSTRGLFAIEFAGHALEATDLLLLSELPCKGAGQATPRATPLIAAGCPAACSVPQQGDHLSMAETVGTVLLTHATVGCDYLGANCQTARITSITTGANGTDLTFENDPMLEQGDRITIGVGVAGGTASQLATLRGQFDFEDAQGSVSTTSFTVAHEISRGADRQTWHVPLAFSGPDAATFVVAQEGAEWTRRSRASTRRELLGPAVLADAPTLHVCWTAGSMLAGSWHEVGTLVFQEPAQLPQAAIALVAPISNQPVPAVVAFETGSQAYPNGIGGTALILRFEDADKLAPRTISGQEPTLGLSRSAGSQGHCANVILETWSSQSDLGFPLPRRCRFGASYHRGTVKVLELEIEFEPQTGLMPSTKYQLVLNVIVADGVGALDELLHVEASADLSSQPNAALEAGHAPLLMESSPVAGASGSGLAGLDIVSENSFSPPGSAVEIVPLDDTGSLTMSLRLSGDSNGGIAFGSNLRIILWPLTQWSIGDDIAASCKAPFRCSPAASSEALENRVVGQRNSILLSAVRIWSGGSKVAISDTNRPILVLAGSSTIVGGFFAARPAIFVSNSAATRRQYFQPTSGAVFHKTAAPVATLVSSRGHGNAEPFPFAYNTLYLRLFLPASMSAGGNLTIQSPGFFRDCGPAAAPLPRAMLLPNPLRYPGGALSHGVWSTSTLFAPLHPNLTCCNQTVLPEDIPQTCRWVYSMEDASGLLAGSSAYIQVTVRNPPFTIERDNLTSIWQVSMHDSGLNTSMTANFTIPTNLMTEELATNLPVIRPMPFAQTLPGSLLPGAQHTLQVFFAVSEAIRPVGAVEVWAPEGFDFGSPCSMADLSDDHYRYGTGPISAVLERVPIPQGCSSRRWPVGSPENTVARIGFGRPVLPGRRYAFGLTVLNPDVRPGEQRAAWTQQPLVWAVRAFDAAGNEVEGTDGTAALDGMVAGNASQSWDLCDQYLDPVPQFRWGTLLPFPMTLATSHVTILPLEFSQDMYVPLRLTAPLGYVFETPGQIGDYWMSYPPGATASMPGGLPTVFRDIYLQWEEPILFRTGFRYGFRTPVQVPEWPQTSSAFYLELGHVSTAYSPQRHPLGFVMPGPETLRVVRAPQVDYMTGLIGEQQEVTIRLTTVTIVYPEEGFLFVGGSATVRLYCTCPSEEYLTGLDCTLLSGQMTGYIMFRLTSTTSLRPGTYKFPFWCTNPSLTEALDTWTIGTYEEPQNYPQVVQVDGQAIVPGFAVQPGMPLFERLPATIAAGFDPRSRRRCSVILAFMLNNETLAGRNATIMRLRAPEGTLFAWQCLSEVVTSASEVFGPGVALPRQYAALPPVHLCDGQGHIAYIHWEEQVLPNKSYAFRVTPLNPVSAPVANVWTLEIDGQSSRMVDGFHVQAFQQVTLEFTSTGARLPGSIFGSNLTNRVRMRFAPTVEGRTFELTAPAGFDFGSHQLCSRLRLLGRSDQVPGLATSTTFVPRLSSCEASGLKLLLIFDRAENWTLRTGATYELDADILLPLQEMSPSASVMFHLLSTAVDGGFGDEYTIEVPQIWRAPLHFDVRNVLSVINAPRPTEVDVEVTFGTTIRRKERIELQLPRRFTLNTEIGPCPATWQVPSIGPQASCLCDDSTSICKVTFVVLDNRTWSVDDDTRLHAPWAGGRPLHFSVSVVNPIFQPTTFENAFIVTHFPPVRAHNWTTPYGTGLYRGWEVISPVSGLRFSIAQGSDQRAGAMGVLHLTFVPSNDATILRVTALDPAGWNFLFSIVCQEGQRQSLCRTPTTYSETPAVLELLDTNILSGVRYVREFHNTQLAPVGGPTAFSLETFIQDSQGKWIRVDFEARHESFRLPGLLAVAEPRLRTVRAGTHPADELWAQLPPHLGRADALALWRFSLTQAAAAGDWLAAEVILDGTLELDTQLAGISVVTVHPDEAVEHSVGDFLPIRVEQVSPKEVRLHLEKPLKELPAEYHAYVSGKVLQDLQANGGQGASKFLNISVCRRSEPLPIATNDAATPDGNNLPEQDWTVVGQLPDFRVNAQGVAPMSQVMLTGEIPSSLNYPTVTLVAPVGVRILAPCFPSSCASVSTDFSGTGRQAAVSLVTTGEFSLRVEMPRDWYDGSWVALTPNMGWPQYPEGSAVAAPLWQASRDVIFRQMPVGLAYPAVGGVTGVRMTVSFQPGIGAVQVLSSAPSCFVRVQVPLGYRVRCGAYFRTITLPVLTQAFCVEELGATRATVTISAPDAVRLQSAKEIVFAFGLEVAAQTPQDNLFEVVLLTPQNVTVDSNTVVPGLPIPPERLRSSVVLEASGFESLAWLQSWAAAAHSTGALAEGLAGALQVSTTAIVIDSVEARLQSSRRLSETPSRELAGMQGEISIVFFTMLSRQAGQANNLDVLQPRFEAQGLEASVATSISQAAERVGLAPVAISGAAVAEPVQIAPPNVTNPSLSWRFSQGGAVSLITVGMYFQSATSVVSAILISMPPGFTHELQGLSDLSVTLNGADHTFPVASEWGRAWIDARARDAVRILIANGALVQEGGYTFQFPVRLPQTVPALNLWKICLCTSMECDSPEHASVVTIFALPGFRLGESYARLPVTANAWALSVAGVSTLIPLLVTFLAAGI